MEYFVKTEAHSIDSKNKMNCVARIVLQVTNLLKFANDHLQVKLY